MRNQHAVMQCRIKFSGRKSLAASGNRLCQWLKLGNIQYRRGAMDDARASWERALSLDANNRIVRANLDALSKRTGNSVRDDIVITERDTAVVAIAVDESAWSAV